MATRSFVTYQEAFDATMEALAKQGYLSSEGGDCFYRHFGNHNIKCAVGMWLTDEEAAKYEGHAAFNLPGFVLPHIQVKNPGTGDVDTQQFWELVQNIHDSPNFVSNYIQSLQNDFGVNVEKFNLIKDLPEYGN